MSVDVDWLTVQGLVSSRNRLRWEHQSVNQKQHLLAAQELLQHVAPVALGELRESDLLGLDHLAELVQIRRRVDAVFQRLARTALISALGR